MLVVILMHVDLLVDLVLHLLESLSQLRVLGKHKKSDLQHLLHVLFALGDLVHRQLQLSFDLHT